MAQSWSTAVWVSNPCTTWARWRMLPRLSYLWINEHGLNGNSSNTRQHGGGNGTYGLIVDIRGFYRVHGVRRAGYPVHVKGVSMGKLTDEEKGLLSMVQCTARKNLDNGAEGAMIKIFSLLPYAVAVVLAVVVFAWGQT